MNPFLWGSACAFALSSCYLSTAERVQDWNRSCTAVYLPQDGKPHVYRVGDSFYLRGKSTTVARSGLALTSFYSTYDNCSGTYTPLLGVKERIVYRKLEKNDFSWIEEDRTFALVFNCHKGVWDDWVTELPAGARPLNAEMYMSFFNPVGGSYIPSSALKNDGRCGVAPVLAFPLKWLVDVPVSCVATTVYGVGLAVATPVFIFSQQMQSAPPPPTPESAREYEEYVKKTRVYPE